MTRGIDRLIVELSTHQVSALYLLLDAGMKLFAFGNLNAILFEGHLRLHNFVSENLGASLGFKGCDSHAS